MLLTQRIRKSCPQSEIFSLGGQYYGLGQSNQDFDKDSSLLKWPYLLYKMGVSDFQSSSSVVAKVAIPKTD